MTQASINHWENRKTEGKDFLSYLRNSSHARNFCRQLITELIHTQQARSLLEVGVGGLNEYLTLRDTYLKAPNFRFIGTDWTPQFLEEARSRFPEAKWEQLDITQCGDRESLHSDIVYSQHVLEHCPGLNPALSNMLQMANKIFINVFFMPPQPTESINCDQYPLYHNIYSVGHIVRVCEHHGFICDFKSYNNKDMADANECQNEVVLLAVRREARE